MPPPHVSELIDNSDTEVSNDAYTPPTSDEYQSPRSNKPKSELEREQFAEIRHVYSLFGVTDPWPRTKVPREQATRYAAALKDTIDHIETAYHKLSASQPTDETLRVRLKEQLDNIHGRWMEAEEHRVVPLQFAEDEALRAATKGNNTVLDTRDLEIKRGMCNLVTKMPPIEENDARITTTSTLQPDQKEKRRVDMNTRFETLTLSEKARVLMRALCPNELKSPNSASSEASHQVEENGVATSSTVEQKCQKFQSDILSLILKRVSYIMPADLDTDDIQVSDPGSACDSTPQPSSEESDKAVSNWIENISWEKSSKLATSEPVRNHIRSENKRQSSIPAEVLSTSFRTLPSTVRKPIPVHLNLEDQDYDHRKPDWYESLLQDEDEQACTCAAVTRDGLLCEACMPNSERRGKKLYEHVETDYKDGLWDVCKGHGNGIDAVPSGIALDQPQSAALTTSKEPQLSNTAQVSSQSLTLQDLADCDEQPSQGVPKNLYKTSYEDSATVLSYTNKKPFSETLKLKPFMEKFGPQPEKTSARDMSYDCIARPLGHNKNTHLTSPVSISTFSAINEFINLTEGQFRAPEAAEILEMCSGQFVVAEAIYIDFGADYMRRLLKIWLITRGGKLSRTEMSRDVSNNQGSDMVCETCGSSKAVVELDGSMFYMACHACKDSTAKLHTQTANATKENARNAREPSVASFLDLTPSLGNGSLSTGSKPLDSNTQAGLDSERADIGWGDTSHLPYLPEVNDIGADHHVKHTKEPAFTAAKIVPLATAEHPEDHWTTEDDKNLSNLKTRYPHRSWRKIATELGISVHRCKERFRIIRSKDLELGGTKKQQGKKARLGEQNNLEWKNPESIPCSPKESRCSGVEEQYGWSVGNQDISGESSGQKTMPESHHEPWGAVSENKNTGGGYWCSHGQPDGIGGRVTGHTPEPFGDGWGEDIQACQCPGCISGFEPCERLNQTPKTNAWNEILADSNAIPEREPTAFVPKTYTVTYWAKVECADQIANIPIDNVDVSGPVKTILDGPAKKVWKWVQDKGLGDKISLQDAFDLAKDVKGDSEEEAEAVNNNNKDHYYRSPSVLSCWNLPKVARAASPNPFDKYPVNCVDCGLSTGRCVCISDDSWNA
jgi:hypothetical protein